MKLSELSWFPKQVLGHIRKRKLELFAFFLAFGVRSIPEVLSWPEPLGFDTVTWLAPFMMTCQEKGLGYGYSLLIDRQNAPLAYGLFGLVASTTSVHPLLLTKIMGPFLFGFLVWSFFYFSRKTFHWNDSKVLVASIIICLYFIPLRISWDLYRNLLGIAFLMIALSHYSKLGTKRDRAIFLVFCILAILAHELVAVFILFLCTYLLLLKYLKKKEVSFTLFVCVIVATILVLYYAHWLFPASGATVLSSRPVEPVKFPMDYLSAKGPYSYAGLGGLYADVLVLASLSFLPILPLSVKGFFRSELLNGWTILLSIGSFAVIFSPTMAIPFWHRWMFMLIFPAILYGTNFLLCLDKKKIFIYLALLIFLSATFIALPPETASPYFSTPYTVRYVPSSMIQNSISLSDSKDVKVALEWLNDQAEENSTLLAHYAFVGWAELYTNNMEIVSYFTIEETNEFDFEDSVHVYTIWWERGSGWYRDQTPPQDFFESYKSGRIVIYELSM